MYQTIWKDYKADFFRRNDRLPREKSFSIGRAIWAISREKGIKFLQLATRTKLSEGTLLRMAASHKLTSSLERIESLAGALGVSLEEFFRAGREEFYGNFFITKSRIPHEEEIKEYARHGLFLQKQSILRYPDENSPDFRAICHTPPIESLVDFFAATILISPGKTIRECQLAQPMDIYLAVANGAVQIEADSGEKIEELVAGQSAVFNGNMKHAIRNLSDDREAEILLSFAPTELLGEEPRATGTKGPTRKSFDIASLIEQAQTKLSPDPENPMPLSLLARLAGLEPRDFDRLVKEKFTNLPIEKLERLAETLDVPFESLVMGCPFQKRLNAQVTKGTEKGTYDWRPRFGITFYPWLKLGTERKKMSLAQATLEPELFRKVDTRAAAKEKIWEGKNQGYLLAKGIGGKLGVQMGERHNYPDIDREDTVYLDMSFGFSLRNLSPAESTNFFMISSPPLF